MQNGFKMLKLKMHIYSSSSLKETVFSVTGFVLSIANTFEGLLQFDTYSRSLNHRLTFLIQLGSLILETPIYGSSLIPFPSSGIFSVKYGGDLRCWDKVQIMRAYLFIFFFSQFLLEMEHLCFLQLINKNCINCENN